MNETIYVNVTLGGIVLGSGGAVASVNGKVGAVTLSAADVGATTPAQAAAAAPVQSVNGQTGAITIPPGSGGITQLTGDVTTPIGAGPQTASLATVNNSPGTTGGASVVPVITYNAKGLVTAVGSSTITPDAIGAMATGANVAATQMPAFSGDATTTAGATALTLATVNGNAGTFGSSSVVPIPTFDSKGRVTAVGTAAITPAAIGGLAKAGDTATGTISGLTSTRGDTSGAFATSAFVANHSPLPNIMDFGADNTGVNDCSAAFAACAAQSLGAGNKFGVYFPPGTYMFSAQVIYTLPADQSALTIMGSGQEVTRLVWPGGGGMKLKTWQSTRANFNNSFYVSGLSFLTGKSDGTGSGLNFTNNSPNGYANQSQNKVSHLSFRGTDGPTGTAYWGTALSTTGVWGMNIEDIFVTGTPSYQGIGIYLGAFGNYPCAGHNITRCGLAYLQNGLVIASYIQGVNFANSNVLAAYGVLMPSAGSGTGQDQFIMNRVQIQSSTNGIFCQTNYTNISINGCYFIQGVGSSSPAGGINITNATGFTCTGSMFNQDSTGANNGITLGGSSSSYASIITGNVFTNLTGSAINLTSSSVRVNVQSNAYYGCGANVNSGTGNTLGGGSA